ncbi:hypothetical protein BELL_0143g00120 [Botrytis elliptica]|uniref:Uncharacterized protein n=1 Tax=Botrytis elliptica TaxID=278938 RepID=A0A4Z1JS82_9HELO|nr:hypothetical protein BELL_0143g00120 [Botrytis elliptica]
MPTLQWGAPFPRRGNEDKNHKTRQRNQEKEAQKQEIRPSFETYEENVQGTKFSWGRKHVSRFSYCNCLITGGWNMVDT